MTSASFDQDDTSVLNIKHISRDRLAAFTSKGMFSDVNLLQDLYFDTTQDKEHISLTVYSVPDLKRIPYKEAVSNKFKQAIVGESFGPSWSTHWFHVKLKLPEGWKDQRCSFLWNSNSEVMIYNTDGNIVHSLTGEGGDNNREEYILTEKCFPGQIFEFYLEMACNGMFGNGPNTIMPPEERKYTINKAMLALPNLSAFEVFHNYQIIRTLSTNLPKDSHVAEKALYCANKIMNTYRPKSQETLIKINSLARDFFENMKAPDCVHGLVVVGHCHIDTAWLWPYSETRRKTARSWSSQIDLMNRYPNYKFVCSQAQQYKWLKEDYPELYSRIKQKVAEGKFIPIGGTWVEMDCNIPSGEALCRQFFYGIKYFREEFGYKSDTFWLPDTFGYSAQLPQIVELCGMKNFFTQKLSWNNINKFPHTSFYWVGLNGSKILTHMAPAETYTAQCTIPEFIKSEKNNREKCFSNESLYVYGNGDGGGGPLPEMLERLERCESIQGLPKIKFDSVDNFYNRLRTSDHLPHWYGELYFELHRGTYTTHGAIKKNNRSCEFIMKRLEFLGLMCILKAKEKGTKFDYPSKDIESLWENILLNQFHDVLPGTIINLAYQEVNDVYCNVIKKSKILEEDFENFLFSKKDIEKELLFINYCGWKRTGLLSISQELLNEKQNDAFSSLCSNEKAQKSREGDKYYLYAETLPFSFSAIEPPSSSPSSMCKLDSQNNIITISNNYILATFDQRGLLTRLYDILEDRELIPHKSYGNLFKIYEDIPFYWDAWDVELYHLEKHDKIFAEDIEVIEKGPLLVSISIFYKISEKSSMKQTITLGAYQRSLDFDCTVEWSENRKFLKTEFCFDIMSEYATYETQYGSIRRPTHFNTTWDTAKFEVCMHKFFDLSEHGYGVAILNDCKYGAHVLKNNMRLSLIRSPKAPDSESDIGKHSFKYSIYPHKGTYDESDVVQKGHEFNVPLTVTHSSTKMNIQFPVRVEYNGCRNVILDWIKKAEETNNEFILRFYEAYGGKAKIFIEGDGLNIKDVYLCNILEETSEKIKHIPEKGYQLNFSSFQILSVKIVF